MLNATSYPRTRRLSSGPATIERLRPNASSSVKPIVCSMAQAGSMANADNSLGDLYTTKCQLKISEQLLNVSVKWTSYPGDVLGANGHN